MHANVVEHNLLHTYRKISPEAQFCAILLLLFLGPPIIAIGVFRVFPVTTVYETLVSKINSINIWAIWKIALVFRSNCTFALDFLTLHVCPCF